MTDPETLTLHLRTEASALGFDLFGAAPAFPVPEAALFSAWLESGYAGEMSYLARRKDDRQDPSRLLPGVNSVICLAVSYRPSADDWPLVGKHPVSCYAWGADYHRVLGEKLKTLALFLEQAAPGAKTKFYVDTGPVLERGYAARAGLGWIGKNGSLLNEKLGSFLFLSVILTDVLLAYDSPVESQCGDCSLCRQACPTGALVEPGTVDARKCASYLTLECRSEISDIFKRGHQGRLAGCDLCQACCPFNASAPAGRERAFQPRGEMLGLTVVKAAEMSKEEFHAFTLDSALERVKFAMWRRNIEMARKDDSHKS